jgi:hypothetical protein
LLIFVGMDADCIFIERETEINSIS